MDNMQLINVSLTSEASLYRAYMPFVKNGGLFIRTNESYLLGDELQLSVTLVNEYNSFLINAKVVWITPKGAQGSKPAGIGVQFLGDTSNDLCRKIESYIAGMLKSNQLTDAI